MKKLLLLLIAPILMATQCEDDNDPLVSTEFYIQNNSSVALTYLTESATEFVIESNSSQFIAINTNEVSSVVPGDNTAFTSVVLYKPDDSGMLITAYEQDPINNESWELTIVSGFDYTYTLVITDDLID